MGKGLPSRVVQEPAEDRLSNDDLEEDMEKSEVTGQDNAEDRFLVDIGSLLFPSTYPQPAQAPQQSQGSGILSTCTDVVQYIILQVTEL